MSDEKLCAHCGGELGSMAVFSIETNKPYCSDGCAWKAKAGVTVDAWRVPEQPARDERALTISDIYLAEFVGVLRRALNKGGLTDRLDDILDSWCDEQEAYLEEKYPTNNKRAPTNQEFHLGPEISLLVDDSVFRAGLATYHDRLTGITVDWRDSLSPEAREALEKGARFAGLSELITTGYYDPVDTAEKAEVVARQLLEATRQAAENIVRQYPPTAVPEMEGAGRDKMTPFERRFPAAYPSLRRDKSGITTILSINDMDDTGAIAIEPEEPRLESMGWNDNRAPVAPCSCRQFQGDSLGCPQHGRGSAWYDLHGGE